MLGGDAAPRLATAPLRPPKPQRVGRRRRALSTRQRFLTMSPLHSDRTVLDSGSRIAGEAPTGTRHPARSEALRTQGSMAPGGNLPESPRSDLGRAGDSPGLQPTSERVFVPTAVGIPQNDFDYTGKEKSELHRSMTKRVRSPGPLLEAEPCWGKDLFDHSGRILGRQCRSRRLYPAPKILPSQASLEELLPETIDYIQSKNLAECGTRCPSRRPPGKASRHRTGRTAPAQAGAKLPARSQS